MGKILRPHGVKGAFRLRSFMENASDIFDQPCHDSDGKAYQLTLLFPDKQDFVCKIDGINDRDQADTLKGTELLLPRDLFPEINDDDTYYHADLIGLDAVLENGDMLGKVLAIHNFGAGDLVEISNHKDFIPFEEPYIGKVDLKAGSIQIQLPTYV